MEGALAALPPPAWRTNLWLFLATVASVFVTSSQTEGAPIYHPSHTGLVQGAQFTGALLAILLAHEFGHYIAARLHRVDASLPFFIPLPILSPFGTMGAVIRMRGVIPTRKALLDIGASGPLAGLTLAIPMYFWGASHSTLVAIDGGTGMELGESILLMVIDRIAGPAVPAGMELSLSPVAFAAWAGMFVTMINLLPVGQLDGGHVAYALFGPKQDRYAMIFHRAMLAFFFVSLASYLVRDIRAGIGLHRIDQHVGNSLFWLVWFEMLAVLGSLSSSRPREDDAGTLSMRHRILATVGLVGVAAVGREHSSPLLWIAWFVGLAVLLAMEVKGGVLRKHALLDHPPTGPDALDRGRVLIAVLTLLFFVLLFMPAPFTM
jgi:membrane-associated protease RseP (regulator of RpoE activity)